MLCKQNDDITYYTFFIVCIAPCKKVSCHELAIASMQRAQKGELTCILEAKVGICRRLVQGKGHLVGLFPV